MKNHLKKQLKNGHKYFSIIATLVDNELPGVNPSTHRSGRILKTL